MNKSLAPASGVFGDAIACYDLAPFGLVEADFIDLAIGQFQKRIERLERARGASISEIWQTCHTVIELDEP